MIYATNCPTAWSRILHEKLSHSASQEISRLLWNPKVHYHARSRSPAVHIPNHMHPVLRFYN